MAWNPSPEVAALRDYSNRFGSPIVVALAFNADGSFNLISYGKTKALCGTAKRIADAIRKGIDEGVIEP